MQKEDQDYYDALLEMFASDGWKYFLEDQEHALKTLKETAHLDCDTDEKWHTRRGEILKLTHVTGYEEFIRVSLDAIEKDNAFEVNYEEQVH